MAAEILFVGDVHLGRRPRRLPADLEEYGVGKADLTPAAAFRATIDHALASGVSAVVFAGDVVDSDNARFEAYGQLQRGVTRLTEHGIAVFAVAGNHDVEALPRLADAIDGFRLLGRGGRWEQEVVREHGRPFARLLGWSFPSPAHATSPLRQDDFPRRKDDDLPLLGVLHCDVGAAESPYAPVSLAELRQSPADAWLLGHIHKPSITETRRPVGYLGSLVGLDPGETGPRGAWSVRVASNGEIRSERVHTEPLRWETRDVALEPPGDAAAVERTVRRAIERLAEGPAATSSLRAVGCRIRLTGETGRLDVRRTIETHAFTDLRVTLGETVYFVDRVEDDTSVELDLETLATRGDPPGLLASRLLSIERGGDDARLLLQQARRELQRTADDRRWLRLEPVELDDTAVRRLLIDAGRRVLAELLEPSREDAR
jgi:DNA repair exonuclease SbcCD nuclease subunit